MAGTSKPLDGLRVLDLSRVLAGPFATAILADLGAEIVKLEPPQGDDYRHIGPFRDGESALFSLTNRGKRSIVVDLKSEDGQALARSIAANCDVVIENFRPGVAARLGLGADRLRAENPGVVVCSISGFGQSGPDAGLPAYDIVVQAMSGWMDATGEEGGAPLKVGEALGDTAAGLYAVIGVLAALVGRGRTGQGATLDVAMLDCLVAMLPTSHALHLYAGQHIARVGNRHPLSTPFGAFPRFATDEGRTAHEPEIRAMIEGWSAALPTSDAVAALREAGIPTAPIMSLADQLGSAHAQARELSAELPHHRLGRAPVVGQPVRFDGNKPLAAKGAPALGADTRAVLDGLGLSADQIAGLIAAGIVNEAKS